MSIRKKSSLLALLLSVGIGGVAAGLLFAFLFMGAGGSGPQGSGEREVAYWVAPMDPNFRRDRPGLSPMGMELVPVYTDEAGAASAYDGVEIDPRIISNIGVETAPVIRATKAATIQTVAHIAFNEKNVTHVHVRAKGWIEKLYVRAVGEEVEAGDPLFDVYSPELNTAQAEYLQALASGRSGLIQSSRARLVGFGLSGADVAELEKNRRTDTVMTVRAPAGGVVTELNVSDQARIVPDRPALTLVDLETVWLMADVFEMDIAHVRVGAPVHVIDVATREKVAMSKVDYLYPDLNMRTRTNPVRILIDNHQKYFRPGQFFSVEIERAPIEDGLFVPTDAIIRLGDGDRVILAEGGGRFRPAQVMIGEGVGDLTQITAGLQEGESVVVGGQFLIDSESSFQGARTRLTSDEAGLETEVFALGEIIELDLTRREITFGHRNVFEYDWGPGEKTLRISSQVALGGLTEGMQVHIGLATKSDGTFIVTALQQMGGAE